MGDLDETEPSPQLERLFHLEMIDIYRQAKQQVDYNATRFIQMVETQGGVATAKRLLSTPDVSDGFTALWQAGRLDLTMEARVLKPEFTALFTQREIKEAKRRLNVDA